MTCTGVAWLSSARVVRCRVKSLNERNPIISYQRVNAGDFSETAGVNTEEGGDDVKSSWPLRLGLHTCYNGWYRETRSREVEQILIKPAPVRIAGCNSPHEVGIASNRGSATPR